MSKITNATKRFENVKVGMDGNVEIRVKGINGEKAMELMTLIDNKDTKGAIKFMVLGALQEDDPTTTEEDFNGMEMIDMLSIANTRAELSGLGRIFEMDKKKAEEPNVSTEQSKKLRLDSLKTKLATKQI